MPKLVKHDQMEGKEFLKQLSKNQVLVYEDVQGSKIWVNWDGRKWNIRPRSLNDSPINMVDLAMQRFYNKAYQFFETLDEAVVELLNPNWHFCFEYFADEQPANIKYKRTPQNNLILTCISKSKKNYSYDTDELDEFARMFDVDVLPVIYRGKLNVKQVELIHYFLNTSPSDLEHIFNDANFASFFYNILNPTVKHSFLMDDNEFQDNMERIIIRFEGSNQEIALQVLNPMYRRTSEDSDTEFVEVYSLLLLNFMIFCHSVDIAAVPVKGATRDEMYLDVVCRLYNMYMLQSANDLMSFEFSVPSFFDQDKFRINKDLIQNKATLDWISMSPKLEYILKIVLGSMIRHKKRAHGVFTERSVDTFNQLIDDVTARINVALKMDKNLQKLSDKLLNFDEFSIRWDADADGKVYPDIESEIDNLDGGKKKKKIAYDDQMFKKPGNDMAHLH